MGATGTRAVWSRIVAVIFAILLPLSTISAWAITTLNDTPRWVATLHPLATNSTITNYLGQQGAQAIVDQFNVESRIEKALPASAAFLAGTITAEVQKTINKALDDALASTTFSTYWDRINAITHRLAISIISGKQNKTINSAHDIVLNMGPQVITAIDQLSSHGITFLAPLKKQIASNRIMVLHLLNTKELEKIQGYYQIAITLRWVLLLSTLVLAVLVVVLARPIRVGVRRLGIALTASASLTYCLLRIGIRLAAPLAPTPVDVSTAILQTITSFLANELIVLTVAGVEILILTWLIGPSDRAVATRRWFADNSRGVTSAIARRSHDVSRSDVNEWTLAHRTQLQRFLGVANVLVIALVLLSLFAWVSSFVGVLVVAIVVAGWFWLHRRLANYLVSDRLNLREVGTSSSEPDVSDTSEARELTESGESGATTPR